MKYLSMVLMVALLSIPVGAQQKEAQRVQNAGTVMKEILNVPDDIPQQLLDKAECVIILPSVVRFAFIFDVDYGRGVMTCRTGKDFSRPWGAPTMMALKGGSFGFQFGGQATDYVLLVMNPRDADSILSSKVKLGAGMSAAAGPKGRDAIVATDVALRAEVLSYSRSRGMFAGAFLDGSTLRRMPERQRDTPRGHSSYMGADSTHSKIHHLFCARKANSGGSGGVPLLRMAFTHWPFGADR